MIWLISLLISAYSSDVEQLGHGRWHIREKATQRLARAWPASALALGRAYPLTSDPEIRSRIDRISHGLVVRLDLMRMGYFPLAFAWVMLRDRECGDYDMSEACQELRAVTLGILDCQDAIEDYAVYEMIDLYWGTNWIQSRNNYQQKVGFPRE